MRGIIRDNKQASAGRQSPEARPTEVPVSDHDSTAPTKPRRYNRLEHNGDYYREVLQDPLRLKTCRECVTPRHVSNFKEDRPKPDGFYHTCKDCVRVKQRDIARARRLKAKYGLTLVGYSALLDRQGGVCAICGEAPDSRLLFVDHRHSDGRIRGLLCSGCNSGLGYFRDDPARLAAAKVYLERWT